jgi:hypothetical protein
MFPFGKKKSVNASGKIFCPKCQSTSLRIEHASGTGVAAMGPASLGSVSSPMPSVLGGQAISPLPPVPFTAENISGGRDRLTCNDCGHQFWVKARS